MYVFQEYDEGLIIRVLGSHFLSVVFSQKLVTYSFLIMIVDQQALCISLHMNVESKSHMRNLSITLKSNNLF